MQKLTLINSTRDDMIFIQLVKQKGIGVDQLLSSISLLFYKDFGCSFIKTWRVSLKGDCKNVINNMECEWNDVANCVEHRKAKQAKQFVKVIRWLKWNTWT